MTPSPIRTAWTGPVERRRRRRRRRSLRQCSRAHFAWKTEAVALRGAGAARDRPPRAPRRSVGRERRRSPPATAARSGERRGARSAAASTVGPAGSSSQRKSIIGISEPSVRCTIRRWPGARSARQCTASTASRSPMRRASRLVGAERDPRQDVAGRALEEDALAADHAAHRRPQERPGEVGGVAWARPSRPTTVWQPKPTSGRDRAVVRPRAPAARPPGGRASPSTRQPWTMSPSGRARGG